MYITRGGKTQGTCSLYTNIYIYITQGGKTQGTCSLYSNIYIYKHRVAKHKVRAHYGVAMISRLLKMIGLFCRI